MLSCILIAWTVHAAARTWTSAAGSEIEAEFLREKYGKVTLKTPEGKLMRINLKSLSHGDQQYIKQLQSGEAPASDPQSAPTEPIASVAAKEANLLPYLEGENWIFTSGRGIKGKKGKTKQSHAIYEGRKYRAVIDERGHLFVQPMNNGEKIGYPIDVWADCSKMEEDGTPIKNEKGKIEGRPVEKFIDPPAPSRNTDKVHLKAVREDDIPWEMIYEFSPDSVTVHGWTEDTQSHHTRYVNRFRLPPSHVFERTTSIVEQKKATANCQLTYNLRGNDSKSYGYSSVENINSWITAAQIKGHYEPLTVLVDVVDSDKWAGVKNYTDMPLYNGYSFAAGRNVGGAEIRNGKKNKVAQGKTWDKSAKIKITVK